MLFTILKCEDTINTVCLNFVHLKVNTFFNKVNNGTSFFFLFQQKPVFEIREFHNIVHDFIFTISNNTFLY